MLVLLLETTTAAAAQGGATTSGIDIGLSELLSGAVGALSIYLLGVIRDMWRQRRERIALMTLVHLEIVHNERILKRMLHVDEPGAVAKEAQGARRVSTNLIRVALVAEITSDRR